MRALLPFCEIRVLNNVKTTPVTRSLAQGIIAQMRLLVRLAWLCLKWRPAIVHIHTCSWFSFWRSSADVVVARLTGRRVVLHVHGAEFKVFLDSLSPFRAYCARMVFSVSNRLIVLGGFWKDVLDCWCNPAKVIVVPNGVQVQPYRVLAQDDIFVILCLANYERRKGQADLLRAAAAVQRTRPIHVALVGFEAEIGQQESLLALAAKLGLADTVSIAGPALGMQKEAWWRRASCFCLPSYNEGLPMSMFEAMARGVAVVATRVGAIPEAVEDRREALLYEAGNISELANHLQGLLDDPAKAERIGHAGRKRLIRDFTLEQTTNRLLAVYRDLMRTTSRQGES